MTRRPPPKVQGARRPQCRPRANCGGCIYLPRAFPPCVTIVRGLLPTVWLLQLCQSASAPVLCRTLPSPGRWPCAGPGTHRICQGLTVLAAPDCRLGECRSDPDLHSLSLSPVSGGRAPTGTVLAMWGRTHEAADARWGSASWASYNLLLRPACGRRVRSSP